jgi:predicted secreted protein
MKTISRLALAALTVAILFTAVRGGDYATLNFIGFSKDGRYLAFEEYGTQDGSGFPYSNIYVVDVAKNAYAATPVRVRLDSETATERLARSRAKLGSTAAFRKFGIVAGNTGKHVVSRMLTDISGNHFYSEKPSSDQTINFAAVIGSMYRSGDYDLKLKSVQTKTKECDYAEDDYDIFMLDLSLRDAEQDRTIVLQKDATLPASRGCPVNYAIQHVYLYENYVAVFLNTYHMGFEGPDMRYMVVTGKIK